MHRSHRSDYRSNRSRSRHRDAAGGREMSRYGPAPSSRDDRRFRDDRDYTRPTNSRHEGRDRRHHYSGNYPSDRHDDYPRRGGRSRSNRRSHRRNRERSMSRETYRRSRRTKRDGRSSVSMERGGYDYQHTAPHKSNKVDKTKDLSDDSASHDDTIGSYEGVPGDVIDKRYEILRDAGLGTFGRVVLCKDLLSKNKDDIVALKVVRKVEKYSESAKIEANILKHVNDKDVRGDSLCVRMHRWFEFQGHVILVFEQLGGSLYDYLKQQDYKPFPLDSIRAYAWQLLTSLKFLHHIKLIHTDLKPENILLVRDAACAGDRAKACQRKGYLVPPLHDQVKLIDFGGATYDDESKSGIINTRQYRSPEVMLGVGWSFPSDIWSAACIIAELYIGELLFVTHENLEHLALIEKCIGSFPADMVARADRQAQKYFTDHGALCWPQGAATRESVDHVRKMKSLEEIIDGGGDDDDGAHELLDLLTRMLAMDPTERVTAADALQHPFFKGVTLQTLHG